MNKTQWLSCLKSARSCSCTGLQGSLQFDSHDWSLPPLLRLGQLFPTEGLHTLNSKMEHNWNIFCFWDFQNSPSSQKSDSLPWHPHGTFWFSLGTLIPKCNHLCIWPSVPECEPQEAGALLSLFTSDSRETHVLPGMQKAPKLAQCQVLGMQS